MKLRILLSWSGGKDACLSFDKLRKEGHEAVCLLTTASREIGRTFGHGEKREMIRAQSEALGTPIHFIEVDMDTYTDCFIRDVLILKEKYKADAIAFGDLYLQEHRDWGEDVAAKTGLEALYPLWTEKKDALENLHRFTKSGYRAMVIRTIKDEKLEKWLGRTIDWEFAKEIAKMDICPMGEAGEYHTFVYDGPLFSKKIELIQREIAEYETTKRVEFESFSLAEKQKGK
nr:diphthine--ammonia ligase [Bacillus sp. OV322]